MGDLPCVPDGYYSRASLISDSPQGSAFPTCFSAQQKAHYQGKVMADNKKVLVKEQNAKEKNDKKEKQYQLKTLARRKRDEQVIAKYKASRACRTHTTKKAMEMFNQWKKEFHLAQLDAKVKAIMRSYATKGYEAEQDLLVEYLGKATGLKHQSKREGKHKPFVIR